MHAITARESAIRFGEFELEPESGELRKDGTLVKLQPQPFKVLVLLATNPGRVIAREEIQRAVWNGETFVDFEHGLNFCIKQIRAALGDNAQAPRYLETLPRRGYRFIAPVETISTEKRELKETVVELPNTVEQAPLKPLAPDAGLAAPRVRFRSAPFRWSVAALAGAVVLIAVAYLVWQRFAPRAVPASPRVMLAVLPFENLSNDPEQDYFSDGMTEEMIAQLGSLQPSRLGVIARTSAMTYKRGGKDIRRIGAELNVGYVLEGSVRRDADRLRITAQLIKVGDQTHLWSESYERSQRDALTVQSEVAASIARALALELLPPERSERATYKPSAEAYDAYLRGRYLWNKGWPGDLQASLVQYGRAIELAPDYALAHAGLADSLVLLGMYYTIAPTEAYPKAKAAALRAIELDETVAEGHTALGTVRFRFDWDWPGAEKDFKRAIELNPSYSRAHHDYAWFLVAMERFDEAVSEIERAQELDPVSPLANSDVGWVYLRARRFDEAIKQIQRTLELEPEFGSAQACLERAYWMKGMYRQALDAAEKAMGRSGASNAELAALDKGDPVAAMKSVERWRLKKKLGKGKSRQVSPYRFAASYAELGEINTAYLWLERAFQERDSELVSIKVDPAFDSLHSDARFDELLRRIGLRLR